MPASLSSAFAAYVPGLLLRQADHPRAQQSVKSFEAAALFADISGFTPLAEKLALHGPSGAEELSSILNIYFEKLIQIIHAHGGDVVKMAGDALTAIWTAEQDACLETATHRAAQCGLAIQESLHEYSISDGSRLSLRIGIGVGLISMVAAGGERD